MNSAGAAGLGRRIGLVALGLALTLVVAIAAAWLLIGRYDFAGFAAARASAALGRTVTIGGLHVTPGRWIAVELGGVRLDNIAGGSRPAMFELGHLSAEVEALSLLRGPVAVRRLALDRPSLLLERVDGTPNWRFGPPQPKPTEPASRAGFPTLLDVGLRGGEFTFRTTGGTALRARMDALTIRTGGDDQPVRLVIDGGYNDVPVRLEGDLQPIATLRNAAAPYGTRLHAASGETTLEFDGTMTDPLNVDGAEGTLALDAPTAGPLLAIAGVKAGEFDAALRLAGAFEHRGELWRLSDGHGLLNTGEITKAALRLNEGAGGRPDDVMADIEFDRLDLTELLGTGARGKRSGADVPLQVERTPDTLVDVRLVARKVVYNGLRLGSAAFAGGLTPGRVTVRELALTYLGARARASGRVEAAERGGAVSAELAVSGADIQQLRRLLGLGTVPLAGRLAGQVVVAATGATLNAAARAARVSAVVSMMGGPEMAGSIAREVIEMASTDVRLLFRKARGMTPVSCLLLALDMRGGVGTISPLRVRAAEGVIAGIARFDLNRRTLDMTIGSEARTTSAFALDIPVRISGSFASPSVQPARWSDGGRALLAATDTVAQLPPGLREVVRRNACASVH